MEAKHVIKTYTSANLVQKVHNTLRIKVYWTVSFAEEIISYLDTSRGQHDPEDLKRGIGELIIELPANKFPENSQNIAYAECSALVYLADRLGLNVFGIDKGVSVQKIQLELQPSQRMSRGLIERDEKFVKPLSQSADAGLLGYTDFVAAYFYGSAVVKPETVGWASDVVEKKAQPDYFNAVRAAAIKKMLEIRSEYGVLHMTYRTVIEFLNMPLHKELADKGHPFTRPYESAVERVKSATALVSEDNAHMIKLRKKFGDRAASLFSDKPPTFVDLKRLDGTGMAHFIVVGYRALYSQETLERLEQGGYTYHDKVE
ncbi:hypothetical protein [Vibrio mediterranei]|uniref:hypothetical protein n=1 Tax=Vibrio mediterranei TaxID=689 RepID=UPI00406780DE